METKNNPWKIKGFHFIMKIIKSSQLSDELGELYTVTQASFHLIIKTELQGQSAEF